MAKDAQAEMMNIGLQDEGGMVDEASGNEVPNGALKEEVRDDQPAMLSPGEFVIPAYAVRYIGVERLVSILREAKQGMEQLDDIGLTGEPNADDAGLETAVLPSDMQEEGGMPKLAVGGFPTIIPGGVTRTALPSNNQLKPQQQFGVAPSAAIQTRQQPTAAPAFGTAPSPLTQQRYKPTAPIRPPGQQNVTYPQYVYSPQGGGGYGVAEYVGPNGQAIFVTTIGGKPVSTIPPGFKTRAVYDKDKADEKDKPTAPPTAMVRQEVPSVDSFESPEGEEGGRVITPDSLEAAVAALAGTQSVTAASLASAAGLLGIAGAGAVPILGSILGFGAKANVISMLSQLGVIEGARKPDDEVTGKRGNRYTNQELIDLVTKPGKDGRTLANRIDLEDRTSKTSTAKDLRPDTIDYKGKAVKADYTKAPNTTEFKAGKDGKKSAIQVAAETRAFSQKVDRSQADANVAAAAGRAETAVTEDIEAGQMGPDLGDLGMEVSDPGSFSAPSDAGSEAGDAGSGDSGFDYGIDSYGFDNKGGLVKKRKRTAKKKKNSKGLVNKRKAPSKKKKKKVKKGKGLASSK